MLYMIRYAAKIYFGYPKEWEEIIKRGMAMDIPGVLLQASMLKSMRDFIKRSEEDRQRDHKWQQEYEEREQKRLEAELRVKLMMELNWQSVKLHSKKQKRKLH